MYVGVEMVFEIWNEIGNLIDDQKNLINSRFIEWYIYQRKRWNILRFRMVYKVEDRE